MCWGLRAAYWLSQHLKKIILGLEPYEIARLAMEKEAILQSIHEGILAVNRDGHITLVNQQARRFLELPDEHVLLGQPIREVVPNSRLLEVLGRLLPLLEALWWLRLLLLEALGWRLLLIGRSKIQVVFYSLTAMSEPALVPIIAASPRPSFAVTPMMEDAIVSAASALAKVHAGFHAPEGAPAGSA